MLPVVGPSGAGKSSFVRAGVIPRLREQGRWEVLGLRPGSQPFHGLATALCQAQGEEAEGARYAQLFLASPALLSVMLLRLAESKKSRVLLFVDQLEELFTLVDDEYARQRFMEAVCGAADDPQGPVRVVLTLRDDFLGKAAETEVARKAFGHISVLRSPRPDALRETLCRPVDRAGYQFEDPDLPDEMVEAVHGEPASLLVLQFAASKLWEDRDRERRTLLRSAYEAMGRVEGALARHADDVLDGLPAREMSLARQILLRLVTPERTRKVVSMSTLMEGLAAGAQEVLERLTGARTVFVRKGIDDEEAELELVHESLITRWGRLSRWVEENREEVAFLAEAGLAAELWEKRGRPDEEVWRGTALRDALSKASRCDALPEQVRRFLKAGHWKDATQRRRRKFAVVVAMAVLAFIALVLGLQERKARRGWDRAEHRHAAAQREGARAALRAGDPFEARAKLRGSLETQDSVLARALWWKLREDPRIWAKRLPGAVFSVAVAPDGQTVAAAPGSKAVYLLDVDTGQARILRGHNDRVVVLDFSPGGDSLAVATWAGDVGIWDLNRSDLRLLGNAGRVGALAFSSNGRLVATGGRDGIVRLWNTETGVLEKQLQGHTGQVNDVHFSRDGRLLASTGHADTVRIWDVTTGIEKQTFRHESWPVNAVSLEPGGRKVASGDAEGTISIWDVETGEREKALLGHTGSMTSLVCSPDGRVLISGSRDGTVRIWDVEAGAQDRVLHRHSDGVLSVRIGPRGRILASGGSDQFIRLFDLQVTPAKRMELDTAGMVLDVSFSPDGRLLASGSDTGDVRLWDVKTGALRRVLVGHERLVLSLSFSPDGELLASVAADMTVRVWDVETGSQRHVLRGHVRQPRGVSFSPDGTLLATGPAKNVRLWDAKTGDLVEVLPTGGKTHGAVRFSPDGRLLAAGSESGAVRLWDIEEGTEEEALLGHEGLAWGVSFSPDSKLLASAGYDNTLRIWDLQTLAGRVLVEHTARLYLTDFHPDGRRVGAGSSDGTARIWNLDTGKALVLRGHHNEVNALRFSPDGTYAATTSDDGTVRLWSSDTGEPVWRAPALLRDPPELLSHVGWDRLDPRSTESIARPIPEAWRRAVEARAAYASESDSGRLLCLRTHENELELWDKDADQRLFTEPVSDLEQVVATPYGCLTLARGQVRLHEGGDEARLLAREATVMAWSREQILVATNDGILVFDERGEQVSAHAPGAGATALAQTSDFVVVGFLDGSIELVHTRDERTETGQISFEGAPSSAVVRVLPGPRDTLIAAFSDGLLGIWSLENGTRLYHTRLHALVTHLLLEGDWLYAVSELGQHVALDLSVFSQDYCELLGEVWSTVPVVWEGGLVVWRAPSASHRCFRAEHSRSRAAPFSPPSRSL